MTGQLRREQSCYSAAARLPPALSVCRFTILLLLMAAPAVSLSRLQSGAREQQLRTIQQLIQQGDLTGARRLLTEGAKDYPADPLFANFFGVVEAQAGNYPAAETHFKQAVALAPEFVGAYLNLGRLYQENSVKDGAAPAKALQIYQQVLQLQPGDAEANYQSAVLLQRLGRFKESLLHLERLPPNTAQSAQALAVRLALYIGLGQQQASRTLERLLDAADLSEPDVLSILPTIEKQPLSWSDDLAIRLLEKLAERGHATHTSWRNLGLLYERKGQLPQARGALERAATTDRPTASLLIDLARLAHKQRDHKGALGYLAHARDLEPNDGRIHFFFGMICVEMELVAEAHQALGRAVSLDPNNAQYTYAMGVVSTHRRDPSESIPYFQKYVQLKPDDPRGRLSLGAAYFIGGSLAEAKKELTFAAGHQPSAAEAHYYLGRLARRESRLEEATQEFEQAIKLRPNYADAHAELGHCLVQLKEYERAEKSFERALEIDPKHYQGNFGLLALYSRTKDRREAEQARRFEEVKKLREQKAQDFLRMIEVRPY
ncbi:MAG: tetratricopeptide repeat protein [Pyrinomonadaceae bacterium]|nr:tetratricopeptide repeat protein [Pyrinomonadaceae bacterium]